MKRFIISISLIILLISYSYAQSASQEAFDDPSVFGIEIEKILNLGSGVLALGLFIISYAAYKRKKNKRLAFVCLAFFLFAAKGFMTSLELFGLDLGWVDPLASIINFGIILSFFFGVLKK